MANRIFANVPRNKIHDIVMTVPGNVLFFGPRGTGKSTEGQRAAEPGQPSYSITLEDEGSAARIEGHFIPAGEGKFKFHPGVGTLSWMEQEWDGTGKRGGALLIINELDQASQSVSDILHVFLDDPEIARHTLPTDQVIMPAPGFRCIATMNGTPQELSPAVLDRFSLIIPVTEPSHEQLDLLPADIRKLCVNYYKSANGAEPAYTFRQLWHFATAREKLGDASLAAAVVTHTAAEATALCEALVVGKVATAAS